MCSDVYEYLCSIFYHSFTIHGTTKFQQCRMNCLSASSKEYILLFYQLQLFVFVYEEIMAEFLLRYF
jgi:hypothetical protein